MFPAFVDNDGAWHSARVNERELMATLRQFEEDGRYEVRFIVPYRIPTGREQGDAMYSVIVHDIRDLE